MRFLTSVICLILISGVVHAQRSVKNGGGLGEMKAIYLHQNLAQYVAACFGDTELCGLNPSEQANFLALREQLKKDPATSALKIAQTQGLLSVEPAWGGKIQMDPTLLYSKKDLVQPSKEILSLLLAAKLFQFSQGQQPLQQILSRTREIFSTLDEDVQSTGLANINDLVLHQLQINLRDQRKVLFLLEDKKSTYELADLIFEHLGKGAHANFEVDNIRSENRNGSVFVWGDLRTPENTEALLVIEFKVDSAGLIHKETLKVSTRNL